MVFSILALASVVRLLVKKACFSLSVRAWPFSMVIWFGWFLLVFLVVLFFQFPLLEIFPCTQSAESLNIHLGEQSFNSLYLRFFHAPYPKPSLHSVSFPNFQFPLLEIFPCTEIWTDGTAPRNELSIPFT